MYDTLIGSSNFRYKKRTFTVPDLLQRSKMQLKLSKIRNFQFPDNNITTSSFSNENKNYITSRIHSALGGKAPMAGAKTYFLGRGITDKPQDPESYTYNRNNMVHVKEIGVFVKWLESQNLHINKKSGITVQDVVAEIKKLVEKRTQTYDFMADGSTLSEQKGICDTLVPLLSAQKNDLLNAFYQYKHEPKEDNPPNSYIKPDLLKQIDELIHAKSPREIDTPLINPLPKDSSAQPATTEENTNGVTYTTEQIYEECLKHCLVRKTIGTKSILDACGQKYHSLEDYINFLNDYKIKFFEKEYYKVSKEPTTENEQSFILINAAYYDKILKSVFSDTTLNDDKYNKLITHVVTTYNEEHNTALYNEIIKLMAPKNKQESEPQKTQESALQKIQENIFGPINSLKIVTLSILRQKLNSKMLLKNTIKYQIKSEEQIILFLISNKLFLPIPKQVNKIEKAFYDFLQS